VANCTTLWSVVYAELQFVERYAHLTAYGAVNVFLLAVSLIISPSYLWFIFSLLGWGIVLVIHTFGVFSTGREWQARKMEELTGLKETKDEIHRLTERADALVTILASVDWNKIEYYDKAARD
jgi:hypothetical protein